MQQTKIFIVIAVLLLIFDLATSAIIGQKYLANMIQSDNNNSDELELLAGANIYKLDNCLFQMGSPMVCDPDGILTSAELTQINEQLAELQQATNTNFYPAPPMWDFLYAEKCPQSGLSLSIILLKDSTQSKLAKKLAANFNSKWTAAHPCAKSALALINVGANEPFWAVASHNTDLSPTELGKYFYRQSSLLEKNRLADVLESMIEDIRRNMMLRM